MAGSVIALLPSSADLHRIQNHLLREAIDVRAACTPDEAVAHLASGQALVILFDMDIRHHWREALQSFLEAQPAARVVLLSRLADERMWLDVLESGGYDLLMKPYQETELRAVVRSALTPIRIRPAAA